MSDQQTSPGASAQADEGVAGRVAATARAAAAELHKSGTPEYDARSHERAVEAARKAQAAAHRTDGDASS